MGDSWQVTLLRSHAESVSTPSGGIIFFYPSIHTSSYYQRWIGIDPGWGNDSIFIVIALQWKDRTAQIVYHRLSL